MIPETSANKTVELWKCTDFPLKWEKHSNLLEGIEAVEIRRHFYIMACGIYLPQPVEIAKKFGDRLDLL